MFILQINDLRQKWAIALEQVIDPDDSVCEKHFEETNILKCFTTQLKDVTISSIPRDRYSLVAGAVPTKKISIIKQNVLNDDNVPMDITRTDELPAMNTSVDSNGSELIHDICMMNKSIDSNRSELIEDICVMSASIDSNGSELINENPTGMDQVTSPQNHNTSNNHDRYEEPQSLNVEPANLHEPINSDLCIIDLYFSYIFFLVAFLYFSLCFCCSYQTLNQWKQNSKAIFFRLMI